jgi:hypothetical protein
LLPLFATGVVDTGAKFAASIVDTGGKFATGVNTILAVPVAKFAAGVVDTCGAPSLTNVFLRIFKKIQNEPTVIFGGLGKDDS